MLKGSFANRMQDLQFRELTAIVAWVVCIAVVVHLLSISFSKHASTRDVSSPEF